MTTIPATHSRDVGGRMNITTANATSANRTPVSRTGLLSELAIAELDAEEYGKEGNQELDKVVYECFVHFVSRSSLTACALVAFSHLH